MEYRTKAVDKLPSEIIAMIMVLVMSSHYVIMGESLGYPITASWAAHVQLTLVCRSWRRAALSYSEYWADLPFFRLASCSRFQDMLARSRTAPLRLILDSDSYIGTHLSEASNRTLLHINDSQMSQLFDPTRVLDVHLYADQDTQTKQLAHYPETETPRLRSIFLYAASSRSRSTATFPKHILARLRPALEELYLHQCSNPWVAPLNKSLHPNLSYLQLKDIQPRVPLRTLASVLACTPKLRELWLHNSISGAGIAGLSQAPGLARLDGKIKLPALIFLRLYDDGEPVHSMYRLLGLPTTTDVDIRCDYGLKMNAPLMGPLVRSACHTFGIASSNAQRSFPSMDITTDSCFPGISVSLRSPSTLVDMVEDDCDIERFKVELWGPEFDSFLAKEHTTLQVVGVQELKLEDREGAHFSDEFLEAVFKNHPDVTTLSVTSREPTSVADTLDLLNIDSPGATQGGNAKLLPKLRALRIIAGDEYVIVPAEEPNPDDEELCFNQMKVLLQTRTGENALSTLQLFDLDWMDKARYALLEELADRQGTVLSWEGFELDDVESDESDASSSVGGDGEGDDARDGVTVEERL